MTEPETTEPTPRLELNGPVPDFKATTTHGPIQLYEWERKKWVILFSHPADFTPVCTTEFMAFARLQNDLAKRNVALLGNSIDSIYSHIAWVRNIKKNFDVDVGFPIIADLDMNIGVLRRWVALEIRSDQLPIPGPVVFGICCGMYTDKTLTGFDESLKSFLFIIIQNITGRK